MKDSRSRRLELSRRLRGSRTLVSTFRASAIATVVVMVAAATPLSAQLTSDQLEVNIAPSADSRVISTFVVHNAGDHPSQAILTREDWDRGIDGENKFMPSGSTPQSCGALLSFFPATFIIEPGGNQVVRLAVEKTAAAPRECWDIVFVQEVAQKKQFTRNGLQYVFRTGVKVYVSPNGLARNGAITHMSLDKNASSKHSIGIEFRNSGETHLAAKGRIEIRRADNSVVAVIPIPQFPTLPGALRKLEFSVPANTPPGNYMALAMIDFGGSEIAAGELELDLH